MSIEKVFANFSTTPYLFIGSGLSLRYYGLPNWNGLLEEFCSRISDNELTYTKLKIETDSNYPKIGERISEEFNKRWFDDASIKSNSLIVKKQVVEELCSPFKAEVALFIKNRNTLKKEYDQEIEILTRVLSNHVSGVLTTNYDKLIESIAPKYKVYSSQEELITAQLYGIGELYKIHGDVDNPGTMVLTEKDYEQFEKKYKYLAAKLLTIFSEFPIVFLGYSISDNNIRKILQEMAVCYPKEHLASMASRIVFISYKKDVSFNSYVENRNFGDCYVPMTVVETNNFLEVYSELEKKKTGFPIYILRKFQQEIYNYVLTGKSSKMCEIGPYDESLSEDAIVFSIGVKNVINGLVGVEISDWYKDVLCDKFTDYPSEVYLKEVYSRLSKNDDKLPVFKLLSRTQVGFDSNSIRIPGDFESLLIAKRKLPKKYNERSIKCIEENSKSIKKSTEFMYISYLKEAEYDVSELKDYLMRHLSMDESYIKCANFKRLIRIYDWLKYRSVYLKQLNMDHDK